MKYNKALAADRKTPSPMKGSVNKKKCKIREEIEKPH